MPRVVIAAFDGLQPSQISKELMPTVTRLADGGVRFLHNHAVFPTVTRANSASLVTGVTPGKHGLTANKSVFPDFSRTEVVDALVPKLPEINRHLDGRLLFVPTLGELISAHDLKWVSVVGGTSGNAFVQHPNASDHGDVVVHPEFTNPPSHHEEIVQRFGDWPAKEAPAADLVVRTADVAIEYALGELAPDVLMVWFPEPDTSQHAFGVDSSEAREMYSLADSQLRRILSAVESTGDEPDVFVVSDHGYSTIDSVVNLQQELRTAGFDLDSGQVVIAENGGSFFIYLPGESGRIPLGLVTWLSAQDWVDAVAYDSAGDEHATIPEIGLDGPRQPAIAVTMRSTATGQAPPLERSGATVGGSVGVGSHGGGSSAELHNTLIANGPNISIGVNSEIPSGNIDVAPTILTLLGMELPDHFDGRVLREALREFDEVVTEADGGGDVGGESSVVGPIKSVRVGDTSYLCEFG